MAGIPGENYHLKVMVDFNNDGINETYMKPTLKNGTAC